MARERVLTRRELNRALLERQLLLERKALSAVKAVERLGGLQAQSTTSPYLSLWTRLEGFERDQLVRALEGSPARKGAHPARDAAHRHAVRLLGVRDRAPRAGRHSLAALVRSTPPDRPAGDSSRPSVAAELEGVELTFKEVRALLEPHEQPGVSPTFIWRRIQGQAYIVHVPPSGIWGYGGHGVYTAAEGTVAGAPPPPEEAFDQLVRSYLAAYGPATKQDIGQWAGIPRLAPITASLERQSLRTFRDEQGRTLYDLPRAPLPRRRDCRPRTADSALRQSRALARRPVANPGRHSSFAHRHEQRDRARDDPRRRLRRRHMAARQGTRRARAVRAAGRNVKRALKDEIERLETFVG